MRRQHQCGRRAAFVWRPNSRRHVTALSESAGIGTGRNRRFYIPKSRRRLEISLRLYAPDLEKFKNWTSPKAKKL